MNFTYENLVNDYKKFVSIKNEDLDRYLQENSIDETDGIHIWFDFVITPFVLDSIKNKKTEIIEKTFDFVEECLLENDIKIGEVVEFSLLEGLVSELGEDLIKFKPYFKKETLNSIENIKNYII